MKVESSTRFQFLQEFQISNESWEEDEEEEQNYSRKKVQEDSSFLKNFKRRRKTIRTRPSRQR